MAKLFDTETGNIIIQTRHSLECRRTIFNIITYSSELRAIGNLYTQKEMFTVEHPDVIHDLIIQILEEIKNLIIFKCKLHDDEKELNEIIYELENLDYDKSHAYGQRLLEFFVHEFV